MADPRALKVGDLVRFIAIPDEWSEPGYQVHRSSRDFMRQMIRRRWPSRIFEIREDGYPWIAARVKVRGRWEYHTWGIYESTGWRKVRRRTRA